MLHHSSFNSHEPAPLIEIKLLEMGLWDDGEVDQRNFKREIATRISCRLFQGHIFWKIVMELKLKRVAILGSIIF